MIWILVFGILVSATMLLSLKRPGIALGLVIVMFGLEQFLQTQAAIFVQRSSLINIGVGAALLVSAVSWFLRNPSKFYLDGVQVAVLLLVAFAWLSQYWTISPTSFDRYFGSSLPYFAVFVVLAPMISSDKEGMKQSIWTALYLGIPLVLLFVFLVSWEGRGIRMAAPVQYRGKLSWSTPPLALATMAAQTGMMSIILISKNKAFRFLQFFIFALAAYVAFRTQSRGQMLALALVTLFCYPLANQGAQSKNIVLSIIGLCALSGVIYLVFQSLDLGQFSRWNEKSLTHAWDGRTQMSKRLMHYWFEGGLMTILTGLGVNSSFKISGTYVHNLPCEILGELGLIGISLFAFIYWQVWQKSANILRKLEHYPEMRREAILIIAFFLFNTIVSQKEGSFFTWPHLFFYAIAISHLERHSRDYVASEQSMREIFTSSFGDDEDDQEFLEANPV